MAALAHVLQQVRFPRLQVCNDMGGRGKSPACREQPRDGKEKTGREEDGVRLGQMGGVEGESLPAQRET